MKPLWHSGTMSQVEKDFIKKLEKTAAQLESRKNKQGPFYCCDAG